VADVCSNKMSKIRKFNDKKRMIPTKLFLTKGVGVHKEYLARFELALRNAWIEKCNLVCVSSIFPPNCKIISREEGIRNLHAGKLLIALWQEMQQTNLTGLSLPL